MQDVEDERNPEPEPKGDCGPEDEGNKRRRDIEDCQDQYVKCLLTRLADLGGRVRGQSRCEQCKDACVATGVWRGRIPAISNTGTYIPLLV